jgi:hypothetical protein
MQLIMPSSVLALCNSPDWIASGFLKTRVAHGYCSPHFTAGACPYANICETCDNFIPGPEHLPVLQDQLSDIHQLRADAAQRGWTDEINRHDRVIKALKATAADSKTRRSSPARLDKRHNGRLTEGSFVEERRRTKVIPRFSGRKSRAQAGVRHYDPHRRPLVPSVDQRPGTPPTHPATHRTGP